MLIETKITDTEAELRARLAMAQCYAQMLLLAYDALKSYGVDYQTLPTYKDTTLLDQARALTLLRGQESYITWMGRIEKDIAAGIRRKGFRKV